MLDSNTLVWEKGLVMPRGDSYQLQGQQGGEVLAAGSTGTGPYRWVQTVQDTVFSNLEGNLDNIGDLTGVTIPAGIGIGGNITAVGVTSGLVIAYYA